MTSREDATMRRRVAIAALLMLLAAAGWAAEDYKPDDEGFIRNWLVLAPIPLAEGQSGTEGLGKEQVAGEANLKPKEGDKAKAGDKELAWKKYQAGDYFIDFNGYLGAQTENSVAYAVCYLTADNDLANLTMKTGSDDQAKVYLNGKLVLKQEEARALEKDQDTVENLTLKKGSNVLVFKVVNEGIDWSGCVRFLDKDGKPVKNLKVSLSP
jgi:hypothetical protein